MSVSPSDPAVLKSKREFVDYLKSQDVAVPARTQGRTPQHCERRAAFRLLATLATADRFAYPLTLIHRDRPDFLLQFADRDVGLEFTEALSREEAEIDALAEHMDTSVVLFSDLFTKKDDEEAKGTAETPRRTAAQRRQIIQNPPQGGPGWGDDRGVPQWAEWIMGFVGKKTSDLMKPKFDKYSVNWLLVHDNLPVPFARDTPKRWMTLDE